MAKPTRVLLFLFVFCFNTNSTTEAHPRHSDPVLAELNDYLMAIQLLRVDDPAAARLFNIWDELRVVSWKIRELTDEQNLPMVDSKVMKQVGATRAKQKQLLEECRAYFAGMARKGPSLNVVIDQSVKSTPEAPVVNVQVGHFKVVVIEIENRRSVATKLAMKADLSDEILFWNKTITLAPESIGYTFAVCTPLTEKALTQIIQMSDSLGNKASATIRMQGIPMQNPPFSLLPANNAYKVVLPAPGRSPAKRHAPFKEGIKFTITDKLSGQPLATRIEVKDAANKSYWTPIKGPSYAVGRNENDGWRSIFWEYQPGPYFYIDGKAELGVPPAGKTATVYHGFEYNPVTVAVPENGVVEVAMERWINMPELGWYSGQTHIHTTDVGIPVQFSKYWPLISKSEDLNVSAILTLKGEWETHAIYANEFPMGERKAFSTAEHVITYGEEFRNNPYGHLAFLGLNELIQPISSGAVGELGGPDYPPNSYILDEAIEQGATTIAAHFGNFKGTDQIKTPWPSSGFEMPVDIALDKIQMAEIAGNGGQLDIWYDILNCGFRIPATAGPDWIIKDTPRVYVNLEDEPFTLDNWRKGLQQGKSFITNGPMLFFTVNGEQPGSVLKAGKMPATFEVMTQALTPKGNVPVEIVFNGKMIASTTDKITKITLEDSGWLAIRCGGAHSNPVYVDFEGRPAGYAEPAQRFIAIIDRLAEWVETKGLFYEADQKKLVLEELDKGKAVYAKIIKKAERLGRKIE
ncbi:CehA/McbA family metallohydrolase [Imperialibacter roseus]|uniref:CehA/McbA family metallohydrolase n=1 Tax=Imperialibacter roseus TaxID=1324217 RepID=A0ABZ0IMS1_9BACT|nr:CehA/McbA family metallohydrolase [Imperialibacter roseus]WOK05275.1 CehA/McbA family metallohydrolase [Imperialibacter roseus]